MTFGGNNAKDASLVLWTGRETLNLLLINQLYSITHEQGKSSHFYWSWSWIRFHTKTFLHLIWNFLSFWCKIHNLYAKKIMNSFSCSFRYRHQSKVNQCPKPLLWPQNRNCNHTLFEVLMGTEVSWCYLMMIRGCYTHLPHSLLLHALIWTFCQTIYLLHYYLQRSLYYIVSYSNDWLLYALYFVKFLTKLCIFLKRSLPFVDDFNKLSNSALKTHWSYL